MTTEKMPDVIYCEENIRLDCDGTYFEENFLGELQTKYLRADIVKDIEAQNEFDRDYIRDMKNKMSEMECQIRLLQELCDAKDTMLQLEYERGRRDVLMSLVEANVPKGRTK